MNTRHIRRHAILAGALMLSLAVPLVGGTPVRAAPRPSASQVDLDTASDAELIAAGYNVQRPDQTIALPDGGTETMFRQANGGVARFAVPPPSFNVLQATPAQLEEYGIAPAPTDPASRGQWAKAYSGRAVATPRLVSSPSHRNSSTQSTTSNIFSGYVDAANTIPTHYVQTVASYSEPFFSTTGGCPNQATSIWDGIGGVNQAGALVKNPTLIQAGTEWLEDGPRDRVWYEAYPLPAVDGPEVNPADTITVSVYYDTNGHFFDYAVDDAQKNQHWDGQVTNVVNVDVTNAEFVTERPQENGQTQALANFGPDVQWFQTTIAGVNPSGTGYSTTLGQDPFGTTTKITMVNTTSQKTLATTSDLTNNNGSSSFFNYFSACN
jgi:hypothetical protein